MNLLVPNGARQEFRSTRSGTRQEFRGALAGLAKSFGGVGGARRPKFLANSATTNWYEILGEFRYDKWVRNSWRIPLRKNFSGVAR